MHTRVGAERERESVCSVCDCVCYIPSCRCNNSCIRELVRPPASGEMSDYLRSAFGYLNGGAAGAGAGGGGGNELVGQVIEISGVKLRVNRLIAEGMKIVSRIYTREISLLSLSFLSPSHSPRKRAFAKMTFAASIREGVNVRMWTFSYCRVVLFDLGRWVCGREVECKHERARLAYVNVERARARCYINQIG